MRPGSDDVDGGHLVPGGPQPRTTVHKLTPDDPEARSAGVLGENIAQLGALFPAPAGDATCVFRDSAFVDDVAKTNMAAILEQHGLKRVQSL